MLGPDGKNRVQHDWNIQGCADFDGNGYGDLLWYNTSSYQMTMSMNNGNNSWAGTGTIHTADVYWYPMPLPDVNGDGMADIVWHSTHTTEALNNVQTWFMNGSTALSAVSTHPNIWTPATHWRIQGQ